MTRAHRFKQLDTSNSSSASTVKNDLNIFDFLATQMQSIQQTRCTNHGCSVLIVMKYRDVHFFLKTLLNDETLGCFDVLKVNATKGWAH